jgi:hypothetical protein
MQLSCITITANPLEPDTISPSAIMSLQPLARHHQRRDWTQWRCWHGKRALCPPTLDFEDLCDSHLDSLAELAMTKLGNDLFFGNEVVAMRW